MGRKPEIDKNGMKKGAWSPEEDDKLRAYIMRYGHWNWRQLPKFAGLSRRGKSCRLRWLNYLRKNVKRGNYTKEEDDLIMELRDKIGNKWLVIAKNLPGRTDNEIKNYWHSRLKKLPKHNPATTQLIDQCSRTSLFERNEKDQPSESFQPKDNQERELVQDNVFANILTQQTPENYPWLAESSSSGVSDLSYDYEILSGINRIADDSITSIDKYSNPIGSFWTEPFLTDESYNQDEGFMSPHYPSNYDKILMQELFWN